MICPLGSHGPGGDLIVAYGVHLHDVALSGNHILVESHAICVGIAPIHISLSVVVNPHRRVDVIPVLLSPHERFAKRLLEWAKGRVGNEHTNTIAVYLS